ncbi:MAG: hypothetical protein ACOX8R_00545 [Bacillota bacterium]|jgi:hypothetical protein
METRKVTQVLVYKLLLNDVRGRAEDITIAAVSDDGHKLSQWEASLRTAPYYDEGYQRYYKKDSPLYNYNSIALSTFFGAGIDQEWINEDVYERIKDHPQWLVFDDTERMMET